MSPYDNVRLITRRKSNITTEVIADGRFIGKIQGDYATGFEAVYDGKIVSHHPTPEAAVQAVQVEAMWHEHGSVA